MRSPVAQSLTEAERTRYREDGYFVRESVLSDSELERLRQSTAQVIEQVSAPQAGERRYQLDGNRFVDQGFVTVQYEHTQASTTVRVVEPVHVLNEHFAALIADQRLVQPMRSLLGGGPISLWTAKLNVKQAREGSGFRWHQDSPYWIHDHPDVGQLPNVFVAFDDASPENGCLRLVRGSHTNGCLRGLEDGSQLEGFYTHPDLIDDNAVVAPSLAAGSLLFFSPHLIHGSQPNTSALPRRALIATYQRAGYPELKSGVVGPELR